MTFSDEREVATAEFVMGAMRFRSAGIAVRQNLSFRLQISARSPGSRLPRKVMIVCYFTETKGLVGCEYRCRVAFKVRDLKRFKKRKCWRVNL
jgi:hypothetical protein